MPEEIQQPNIPTPTPPEPSGNWFSKNKLAGYGFLVVVLILVTGGIYLWQYGDDQGTDNKEQITNFEECIAAGYPVLEIGQCRTPDGQIFNEEVDLTANLDAEVVAGWQTYTSDELGVSFIYPSDLKVYQQDQDNILLTAEYNNPELPFATVTMLIRRVDGPNLATKESIDSVLEVLGQKTVDLGMKNNYRILKVEGRSQYYFLTDAGNLLIDDAMDALYKDQFIKEGIYEEYRTKFDAVRDSIIIDLAKLSGISDVEDNLKKSRDSRRVTDIRTIQTALELYFNDNGSYPSSSSGEPVSWDSPPNQYLFQWPIAPTPPDGSCTTSQNNYYYTQLSNGSDYSLTYCLGDVAVGQGNIINDGAGGLFGGTVGDLSAGPHTASPRGIE